MQTYITTPNESTAPYHVVIHAPIFCEVTDGLIGGRTYRDSAMTYETLSGAQWRGYQICRDIDCCTYDIVDALGREVREDWAPRVNDVPADDLPF